MTKANITQYSATPSSNADINDINIAENCPASGLNNAIRELMAHLKNVDTGSQALTALSVTGTLSAKGGAVFNEDSADVDFRVESNGQANMLLVDGGNDTVSFQPNSGNLAIKAGRVDSTNNVRLEAGGTTSTYLEYRGYLGHIFDVNTTEKMRINSSGFIYVDTGGAEPSASQVGTRITGTQGQAFWSSANSGTGGYEHLKFFNGNGLVGSIYTANSATTYATSSDYRLKENVVTNWDATTRLKQLKPSRFNFIADADTTVDGFIAHEVQEIVPEAITGTKDAMTAEVLYVEGDELPDGKVVGDVKTESAPDYQGIDQSKLVPLLVKTIQELEARITALES